MQYSTLRSAYGVNGFEEMQSPSHPPSFQPPEQERDWMSAPPQLSTAPLSVAPRSQDILPNLRPVFASKAPMVSSMTNVPTVMPSASPSTSTLSSVAPVAAVSPPPVPEPIPYPIGNHVNVHPSMHLNMLQKDPRYDSEQHCALCKQRNDREVHLMIVYIASGIFLLLFLDTIVRLAMHLAKKRG